MGPLVVGGRSGGWIARRRRSCTHVLYARIFRQRRETPSETRATDSGFKDGFSDPGGVAAGDREALPLPNPARVDP